jgi:hypothetical protein
MGDTVVELGDAAEGDALEDPGVNRTLPSEAATVATTTRRPTRRMVEIRRGALRADSRLVIPPVNGPWCSQHVSGSRYARDICPAGSIRACVC